MSTLKVERIGKLETDDKFEVSDVVDLLRDNGPNTGAGKVPFDDTESYPDKTVGKQLADLEDQIEDIQLDHIGHGGEDQHPIATETVPGFMPNMPPNDDKTYAFKNGQLVEFTGASPLLAIEWFPGYRSALATERPGCVPCDGQILDRTIWASGWAKIAPGTIYPVISDATWTASNAARRNFSSGDGSTTFRNMDLNGATTGKAYFLRGSASDSFSLVEDMMQSHKHRTPLGSSVLNDAVSAIDGGDQTQTSPTVGGANNGNYYRYYTGSPISDTVGGNPRVGPETAPAHAKGVWIIRLANAQPDTGLIDVNALAGEVANLKIRNGALVKETYYRNPGAISHTMQMNTATYEVEAWSAGAGAGTGGGDGGATTFGPISITGAKSVAPGSGAGGIPGISIGGDINLNGVIAGGIDTAGYSSVGASAPLGGTGGGLVLSTSGNDTTPYINGQQPGGGGGVNFRGSTTGSSGGYSKMRKAVTSIGMTIVGTVGAGGIAGTNGGKGGDGMIIVREYLSSGPSIDSIGVLAMQFQNSIGIGNGQSYQNMTSQRLVSTNYTNSTGRTIFISITGTNFSNGTERLEIFVNGESVYRLDANNGGNANASGGVPVPNGATYRVEYSFNGGSQVVAKWMEYR